LHVLVAKLAAGPFAGRWALPGGRVRAEETLDAAAQRALRAHTGLGDVYLEQLYTFGHPGRDPQGRVVSVAYVGLVPATTLAVPAPADARYEALAWRPVSRLPALAYDHAAVVAMATARLQAKLQYTNLVYTLLPPAFTLGELQALYEAILGRPLDRRNFRKKILGRGLLRALGRQKRGNHRPAALYAFRSRRPMAVAVL
jgi:8-oxo-dGTP diphosphatase